jgi:hypothetical protein
MRIAADQLDATSRAYLLNIAATNGVGFNGMYVPGAASWLGNKKNTWWILIAGGFVAVGLGVMFTSAGPNDDPTGLSKALIQALLGGMAVFLIAWGAAQYLQPEDTSGTLPTFLAIDGRYVWQVTPEAVQVSDMHTIQTARSVTIRENGVPVAAELELKFTDHHLHFVIPGGELSQRVSTFVENLTQLLQSNDEATFAQVHESPAYAAGWALHRLAHGNLARFGGTDLPPEPPTPTSQANAAPPEASNPLIGHAVRGGLAVVIAVVIFYAVPSLNRTLVEKAVYEDIPKVDNGDLSKLERYLDRYPNGQYTDEVETMRDDRRFAFVDKHAKDEKSPEPYRHYLKEEKNRRHREEAEKGIGVQYDLFKTRIKDFNGKRPRDPQLVAAFLALVEGLKTTNTTDVSVGFQRTIVSLPSGRWFSEAEQNAYTALLGRDTALKALTAKAKGASLLLPDGDIFTPKYLAHRERLVFLRLTAALKGEVAPGLFTLRRAKADETPTLEIGYTIQPTGKVQRLSVKYPDAEKDTVLGVLRDYDVQWKLTVRPPGKTPPLTAAFRGPIILPNQYVAEPDDPKWAVYAVLLHLAFYELADHLTRGFGQEPGLPPAFGLGDIAANEIIVD